ncbi:hypothetical protein [Leifsonia poae]|uniref:hypothetical protein n=1 Tax=Leifsonia poae TaxID=110933 RepID=UPI001CBE4C67|nr:hypothetical protein [Leifsonia poae]
MTRSDTTEQNPAVRHLLLNPWVWAALLLAAATVLVSDDPRVGFLAYLLMLAGGWLCGFGFVNLTGRIRKRRVGMLVHLTGAVLAGLLLWLMVTAGADIIGELPQAAKAAYVVAQLAAAPAAGWVWLALIGRVTTMLGRRSAPKVAPAPPAWELSTERSTLRFSAVPLRMRTLGLMIALMVVIVGGIGALLMIATGDLAERLGARVVIIALGIVLGLPTYMLLVSAMHRRTVDCVVSFDSDRLRVEAGPVRVDVALSEIDLLLWRSDSDYARIELRSGTTELCLIAGLARAPKGVAPQLPPLPRHIRGSLESEKLTERRSRRGVTTYQKPEDARP